MAVERAQGGLQADPPRDRAPRSRILVEFGDPPSTSCALFTDGAALGLKACTRVQLLTGRHSDIADDGEWHAQHNYHKTTYLCKPHIAKVKLDAVRELTGVLSRIV